MKNKKFIIIISLAVVLAITTVTIIMVTRQKPTIEPEVPEDSGPVEPVEVGDYIATDYPRNMPREAVSGVLGSLNTYVDCILDPDITVASLLDYSYQSQILRLNITDTGGEAVMVTKENAGDFAGEKNPLRSTKQLVLYAANSGHTINNLYIADEVSTAGVKDFAAYLDGTTPITGTDGTQHYELSEQARKEIVKYCSDMIAENKDTELYILSDNAIAFVMCERYSEESLLGSFSFLERGEDDVYRLRTVIDFNC